MKTDHESARGFAQSSGPYAHDDQPEPLANLKRCYLDRDKEVRRLEDALRITQRDRDRQGQDLRRLDDENAHLRDRNVRLHAEAEKKQAQYERQKQISLALAGERDEAHRLLRALAVNMVERGGPNYIQGRCLSCGTRWNGDRGGETHKDDCALVEVRDLLSGESP